VLLARTGRPWSIGVEAIAVSVGVHGPGTLGAALLRAIPSLRFESSFERVTPDAADLIEVNDSGARGLRAVIAVSVRDENSPVRERPTRTLRPCTARFALSWPVLTLLGFIPLPFR
jgi:hypothetical protein